MLLMLVAMGLSAAEKPWKNGRLTVKGQYLVHENGKPFFWLGNTAWLLSERLNRDEVEFFLTREAEEGYNVEQIQVLNAIPTYNIYGMPANDDTFNFEKFAGNGQSSMVNGQLQYGYWDHLDYIVDFAASQGIYIAMDCIWGSQIEKMTPETAEKYGWVSDIKTDRISSG